MAEFKFLKLLRLLNSKLEDMTVAGIYIRLINLKEYLNYSKLCS